MREIMDVAVVVIGEKELTNTVTNKRIYKRHNAAGIIERLYIPVHYKGIFYESNTGRVYIQTGGDQQNGIRSRR
jgi:hypothetical protein